MPCSPMWAEIQPLVAALTGLGVHPAPWLGHPAFFEWPIFTAGRTGRGPSSQGPAAGIPSPSGRQALLCPLVGTPQGRTPQGALAGRKEHSFSAEMSTSCAVKPCRWSSNLADQFPSRDNILATSRVTRTPTAGVAELFTLSFMAFERTWLFPSWEDGCSERPKVNPGAAGPKNRWTDFSGT